MVQLLIECEEADEKSELCERFDAWRRQVFPTATHLEPTPWYGSSSGWLITLERAGSAGELQNMLDIAIGPAGPNPPFDIDEASADDSLIRLKVSSRKVRLVV